MIQASASVLPVLVLSGLRFEANIAAGDGTIPVCGLGSAALAERLENLARQGCGGILSFGTAGGLAPTLKPGDCVLADAIIHEVQCWTSDADWASALHALLPEAHRGTIAGVNVPLSSSAAKQGLWKESGALAVDMESHWAAQVAHRVGVPFAACRVIVDSAQRSLPSSATAGLQPDGSTALLPILRALLVHPGQLCALLTLAGDARIARNSLQRVRRQVGAGFAIPSA